MGANATDAAGLPPCPHDELSVTAVISHHWHRARLTMNPALTTPPRTDPTPVLRYRDGLHAADLLAAAISHIDFFTWLHHHPGATDEDICRHFGFAARPVDVLLTLCRANGFIATDPVGGHELTDLAREHLVADSPFFLGPYFDSLKDRPVARDYVAVLRSGRPAAWGSLEDIDDWHNAMLDDAFAKAFTAAMDCRGLALGQALARGLSPLLQNHSHLLDVGGGSGIYAATIAAAHPRIRATVLEQPPVDAIARRAIEHHGLGERIDVVTGDFFRDAWPDADVHLLSNVLHDWDVPEVRSILQRSAGSLRPGGLLVIHEVFLEDDKTGPLPAAEYSALLMHVTQGKCYTSREYGAILRDVGFDPGSCHHTIGDRGFMTALRNESGISG